MTGILVTVSGTPRSGKDTLIGHMASRLQANMEHPDLVHVVSSIDPVRTFIRTMREMTNQATAEVAKDEHANFLARRRERQMYADIKRAIDVGLDFTEQYAKALFSLSEPRIVFYQVRETDNLRSLRAWTEGAAEFGAPKMISLFVNRWRTRADHDDLPLATSEQYKSEDILGFDYVVNNHTLDELTAWGDFLADRILIEQRA